MGVLKLFLFVFSSPHYEYGVFKHTYDKANYYVEAYFLSEAIDIMNGLKLEGRIVKIEELEAGTMIHYKQQEPVE